jgi:hypothetical protein
LWLVERDTVQFRRRFWDQTMALNLLRKMTYILRLLTIRLILIEVQDYKQNVYTPLDRSAVAAQQTTHTVDIGTFHVQILAIRS